MSALIAFVVANLGLILGLAYAAINILVAIFDKNEKVLGVIALVRKVLELISALQPKNSAGTVKIPGTPAAPVVTPIMQGKK